jgi:hypothetical protein
MEYHKTKNIVYDMNLPRHKSIQSTQIYTRLVSFESEEYHSATAKTIEEARQLTEEGFERVCDMQDVKLFRKRK